MERAQTKNAKSAAFAVALSFLIVASGFMALFVEGSVFGSDRVRVACVGDSITEITQYPADLQKMLGVNFKVSSFGITGSTVLRNTDRPFFNQSECQDALAFEPKVVVILLGTNDARTNIYESSEDFELNYRQLVAEFQSLPNNPRIYIALPPPIFNNTLNLNSVNMAEGVIPRIRLVASQLHVPLIDANSVLAGHPEDFFDGVHPNGNGARLIAGRVFDSLTSKVSYP